MMVNCPKCGFSQPQDQYCAKCGIDMLTFRPVQAPLWQRLARHTGFQAAALGFVAAVGFVLIKDQNQQAIAQRIASVREAREVEQMDRSLNDSQVAAAAANPASTSAGHTGTAASRLTANVGQVSVTASTDPNGATGAGAPSAATITAGPALSVAPSKVSTAPTSATVTFYEAQRGFLTQVLNSSHNMVNTGLIAYAVIPSFNAKIHAGMSGGGMTKVDEGLQNLAMNQPVLFFKGGREPASGAGLGFAVQLQAMAHDENGTTFQMNIVRSLRDPGNGMADDTELPLSENVVIPTGGALVVAGLLPHTRLPANDEKLYKSIGVLRIMTTDNFKAGLTEAVLIVEPK